MMILDACSFQKRQLDDTIETHTASLIRGAGTRDDDQRIRGIIYGLQIARGIVDDVEVRVRTAENDQN
jgi:hypothetical protein